METLAPYTTQVNRGRNGDINFLRRRELLSQFSTQSGSKKLAKKRSLKNSTSRLLSGSGGSNFLTNFKIIFGYIRIPLLFSSPEVKLKMKFLSAAILVLHLAFGKSIHIYRVGCRNLTFHCKIEF